MSEFDLIFHILFSACDQSKTKLVSVGLNCNAIDINYINHRCPPRFCRARISTFALANVLAASDDSETSSEMKVRVSEYNPASLLTL